VWNCVECFSALVELITWALVLYSINMVYYINSFIRVAVIYNPERNPSWLWYLIPLIC
jgi:hypothetical protein